MYHTLMKNSSSLPQPIKFLCDWILTEDTIVGDAKKQILDELLRTDDLDIDPERYEVFRYSYFSCT